MLKPLNKNVILRKEKEESKTASGIIITPESKEVPNVATVLAVASDANKELSVGLKVVYKEYSGTMISLDDEDCIVIEDKDILAVIG